PNRCRSLRPPGFNRACAGSATARHQQPHPRRHRRGSAPPPVPVATGVASFTPPYAVGPPGIGSDSGMGSTSSASAKEKRHNPIPPRR
ncbi:hypothetical protein I552_0042, partial [Mycobacterium xenopi 3993]